MRKYILISIILVCVYGCGKKNPKEKIKNLENINNNLSLKLEELNTEREVSSALITEVNALMKDIQATENKIEEKKRKHRFLNAIEVEDSVDMKEDMLKNAQYAELYWLSEIWNDLIEAGFTKPYFGEYEGDSEVVTTVFNIIGFESREEILELRTKFA